MPRTEAGKALLTDYPGLAGLEYGRTGEPIIAAIEAQAVIAALDALAAEVEREFRQTVRLPEEGADSIDAEIASVFRVVLAAIEKRKP